MPKLASYDPGTPAPHPINGWWDADGIDYPELPITSVELSQAQWDQRMTGAWGYDGTTLVLLPPAPLSADGEYAARIDKGIALTSTQTPALNGTYPLDTTGTGVIARDAASGLGLPNGAPTVSIADIDGATHDFAEADVIALYKAQRDLLNALGLQRDIMADGRVPSWPQQSVAIP